MPDLGGPEPARLVEQARAFVARRDEPIEIVADSETIAGLPVDALLPGPAARLAGPTFARRLDTEDAAALPL